MAVAGVQDMLLAYTREKAGITRQLNSIMSRMTEATQNTTELMEESSSKKAALSQQSAGKAAAYFDSTEYKNKVAAIQDDYQLQLSKINSWESELEQEKTNLETRLAEINSYEQSWTSVIKQNIKSDFSYGGGSSGSSGS